MKKHLLILFFVLTISASNAQDWRFLGPDDLTWRSINQMDIDFTIRRTPRIAVTTNRGVAIETGSEWKYVLTSNYYKSTYRSVYFSPWADSTAFIGFDQYDRSNGERGSFGAMIPNINMNDWEAGQVFGTGGWIGGAPTLSVVASPHQRNKMYSWIIGLHVSSDNGINWMQRYHDSYGSSFFTVDNAQDSILYAGLDIPFAQSGFFRSTDDGASWKLLLPFSNNDWTWYRMHIDFFAKGDTLLYASNRFPERADSVSGIYCSFDAGISWSHVIRGINVQRIARDPGNPNIFFAATQRGIYRSTDNGISWKLFNNNLPSLNLVDIRKDPYSDTLYVATADSGVYSVAKELVDVGSVMTPRYDFSLEQNYPNPFGGSSASHGSMTTIRFALPTRGFASIDVLNMLGEKITTVISSEMEAGIHEATWHAQGVPSGVYMYRLRFGTHSIHRKLLLTR